MKQFKTDEEYYADYEYVTNSQLGYVKKSPAYYWMMRDGGKLDTPSLRFGSLFHTLCLEPQEFSDRFVIYCESDRPDPSKTMSAKINRAWKEKVSQDAADEGKTIMSLDDYELCRKLKTKLMSNLYIEDIITNSDKEIPKAWIDFNTMSKCKGKADIVSRDGTVLFDLKTTGVEIGKFKRKAYSLGYHRQAAFYMDGFGAKKFVFIVIETKPPYQIGVFRCSEEFIEAGRSEYIHLLGELKEKCLNKTKAINHIIHEEL